MENKLVLGYWAIRGKGERIRLLMEYLGMPYEQEFFDEDNADKYFKERKPQLKLKNPAINLPFLLDG